MNTLILRQTAHFLVAMILVFSVFMLLRGHDQPGGGFLGGLIASIAFSLHALANDVATVRRALHADPRTIAAAGLGIALASGVVGTLSSEAPFLTSQWLAFGSMKIGTPLLFDVGVYLVVIGAAMTILLGIMEHREQANFELSEEEDEG